VISNDDVVSMAREVEWGGGRSPRGGGARGRGDLRRGGFQSSFSTTLKRVEKYLCQK
jgi:hypothetical protein